MSPPQSRKTIAVAIVEDNHELRESMRGIVDSSGGMRCVATRGTGEEAVQALPPLAPGVILMDINLPGMSGVECVRHLSESLPETLIVMLTIRSNMDAVFASLKAGACGYLHKPVHADALVAALNEVVGGGSPMSAAIARKIVESFRIPDSTVSVPSPGLPLTAREQTVLGYLARGFLYKEIAAEMNVSWHTVHNHIRHIYEKLHVRSRAEAVARFHGK